jgi:putative DNA primase/helicase
VTGPYAAAARVYRELGWQGVIPVVGKSENIPPGFTGGYLTYPENPQVELWISVRGADNVALRLPDDVIGIDVDAHHSRPGLDTITWWESQLDEELPLTWHSTSRTDGSRILFYRVPSGLAWRSDLGRTSGVEIIRQQHRYAVVWPSIHPETGGVYRWYAPGVGVSETPPSAGELALLGPKWTDALQRGHASSASPRGDGGHRDDPIDVRGPDGTRVDPERILTEETPPGEQNQRLFEYLASLRARNLKPQEMIMLGMIAIQNFPNEQGRDPWTSQHVSDMVEQVCRRYPAGHSFTVAGGAREFVQGVAAARQERADDATEVITEVTTLLVTDRVTEVGTGPDNPHRSTDRANGIEIAAFLDGQAIWVPEAGWHVYDGRRWAPDVEKTNTLLVGAYTDRLRQRATSGLVGPQEAEALMQRATRVESAAGYQGALKFAEPLLAKTITKLDADPWILNCPNGTLNLRTGELRNHASTDLITRVCPTPYDPEARDQTWERVLNEALEGDVAKLRVLARFAGYSLTGRTTEKKMLVISGTTNTGKSTVTEPIYRMLGNIAEGGYATTWDADVVQADQNVNRSEKLNKARGARMVLVGELSKGSRMADNFVKQFTGGDTMDARALYHDSYSYRPTGKLWMATNYVPQSPDKALQERLLLLPFMHEPRVKDPKVKAHLDDDQAAHRAILAWAARACVAWLSESTLGETPWLVAEKRRYALSSDPILDFLETLVRVDTHDESSTCDEIWRYYSLAWAPDAVPRPLKKRAFDAALEEHGLKKMRAPGGSGARRYRGYRIPREGEND